MQPQIQCVLICHHGIKVDLFALSQIGIRTSTVLDCHEHKYPTEQCKKDIIVWRQTMTMEYVVGKLHGVK